MTVKKIDWKVKMQWSWYKAALMGTAIAVLLAPTAGALVEVNSEDVENNPIVSAITSFTFGPKTKVMINGEVVALAKNEEAAQKAYKEARLAYNAEGVKLLETDVSFQLVDKEQDEKAIKGKKILRNEKLTTAILDHLNEIEDDKKQVAYTMRIDDYTVTVSSMSEVVSMLEDAQGQYDEGDRFQVGLVLPEKRNVMMYEVEVTEKQAKEDSKKQDTQASEEDNNSEEAATEEDSATTDDAAVIQIPEKQTTALTGEGQDTEGSAEDAEGEQTSEETVDETLTESTDETAGADESEDGDNEPVEETTEEEQPTEEPVDADVAAQSVNDGVKYVGFSDKIQVMETYVSKDQITSKAVAYEELTAENAEPSIYVVQPGDSLSGIAAKYNMSVEDVKALNPGIESDDNIYYDDRLTVSVPSAAVQILVQKQETYKEDYYADVVYEDDGEMFIGESEVVQEGQAGTHTVTDLVTYKGDTEYDREQLQETVQVAAVAQVVKRGTKSRPSYMYPCTNWPITSRFGYRWGRLHAGTDVGVMTGTTVRASRAGQVTVAGWLGGYGNCVMIDHGDGVTTVYGHLSEITVSVGEYVDQGERIALSGNTGRSTGPHLHFEIRINGTPVDPEPYLQGTAS